MSATAPNVTALPQGMKRVAYELATQGFRVHPLRHQSKLPAWKGWKTRATDEAWLVLELWPSNDHAPAIATGADYTVIDVEKAGVGVDDVALQLPQTLTVASPRGGRHYYFRTPPGQTFGNSCKHLAPHTDVRGVGGLVAGPGATFRDAETGELGTYTVIDTTPAVDLPTHLIEKMRAAPVRATVQGTVIGDIDAPHSVKRALEYLSSEGEAPFHGPGRNILPGARGYATYRAAGRMGDFGISLEKAKDLLADWNAHHCSPPQELEEFEAAIEHSYEYRLNAIGCDNPLAHFTEAETYCAPVPQAPVNLSRAGQLLWQAGAIIRAGWDAQAPSATQQPTAPQLPAPATSPAADIPPGPIRVSILAGKSVPEREWHAPGVPAFTVTGLFGDGATGKSLLGAQMGVATALAKPWVGKEIRRPGPVLFVGAEDDQDEMHRRFAEIAAKYGAALEDLKQLHLWCLAGEDAVLGAANNNGIVQPTMLWKRISEFIGDVKPTLVIYDTLSDLFAGNENNRGQAMQFTKQLRRPALQTRGSALLLAHPSVAGMASGTGLSGSTGWNNAVRARMYFSRIQGEGGREVDPDARTLQMKKANYGPTGETVNLYWEDGVFVPDSGKPERLRTARGAQAESVFLGLLDAFNTQGRSVSNAKASTYAPAVFFKEPAAQGFSKGDFEGAMSSLFTKNLIRIETTGPESRRRSRLVRT